MKTDSNKPKPKKEMQATVKSKAENKINTEDIKIISGFFPLDVIGYNRNNPRKTFNDIEELATTIKDIGLLQPITIRPVDDYNGKQYEIVSGERRYKAYELLSAENHAQYGKIPVTIRNLSDKEAFIASVIENIQRKEVDPFEEANAFFRMSETFNSKIDEIANLFGKSKVFIYQRMKLCSLCEEAKEYYGKGVITLSHCLELIRISKADQVLCLNLIIKDDGNGMFYTNESPNGLKNHIDSNVRVMLSKACFDLSDSKLDKEAGACLTCTFHSGANKLLFPEIKEKDVCFNTTCYQTKTKAYIEKEKQKELKKGNRVVELSTESFVYMRDDNFKDVLNRHEFVELDKSHKCTQEENCTATGIYVRGDSSKIGSKLYVSTDRNCACHNSYKEEDFTEQVLDEEKMSEIVILQKEKFLHNILIQKFQDVENSSAFANFDNPVLLDLVIGLIFSKSDYLSLDDLVKSTLNVEQYESFSDFDYASNEAIKVVYDFFQMPENNTILARKEFLMKMIINQTFDTFCDRNYKSEVRNNTAVDFVGLLKDIVSIDVVAEDKIFGASISKILKQEFKNEDLFILALQIPFANKTTSHDHELDELTELCQFLSLKVDIEGKEEEESVDIVVETLQNYFK